jgi:hypothetical protein
MHSNFGRPTYSPSGGGYNTNARSSQSPATGEGMTAPPYDAVSPPFPLHMSASGSNHSSMLQQNSHHQQALQNPVLGSQSSVSQAPASSTAAPTDNYSRPPHTPSYYAPSSSTPQQSSFAAYAPPQHSPTQHSPSTTGVGSRAMPALSSQLHSPMQAPAYGRSYGYGPLPPTMGGAVMSNMTNPGGQMTMIGHHMHPMPNGYGHHLGQHIYPHHTAPQQERPFKCDVCPQSFNRNHDLKRHKRIHLPVKPFPCGFCEKTFSRKDALKVDYHKYSSCF